MKRYFNFRFLSAVVLIIIGFELCTACKTMSPKQGIYKNENYRFIIKYPAFMDQSNVKNARQSMVFFRTEKYGCIELAVDITPVPEYMTMKLENIPMYILGGCRFSFPNSSEHRIIHQEIITLSDGTPAVEYDLAWRWDEKTTLVSTGIVVLKGKRMIAVVSTVDPSLVSVEIAKKITRTLEFY